MERHSRYSGSTRLPIWRDANRLLVEIETAVRAFPRHHKYTVGRELRVLAMRVCRLLARALAAADEQRLASVRQLLDKVGDLKITIQLARGVQAFAGFAASERSATLAVAIGQQGGAPDCAVFPRSASGRNPGPEDDPGGCRYHCAPAGPGANGWLFAPGMKANRRLPHEWRLVRELRRSGVEFLVGLAERQFVEQRLVGPFQQWQRQQQPCPVGAFRKVSGRRLVCLFRLWRC